MGSVLDSRDSHTPRVTLTAATPARPAGPGGMHRTQSEKKQTGKIRQKSKDFFFSLLLSPTHARYPRVTR